MFSSALHSCTPRDVLTMGRAHAPQYRFTPGISAKTDKDGNQVSPAIEAKEDPRDRSDWLATITASNAQDLADAFRGIYHEGTKLGSEVNRLKDDLASARGAIKAMSVRDDQLHAEECKRDSARKGYRAAFWTTLVGSAVAIPSAIGWEIHKKDQALKMQAAAYDDQLGQMQQQLDKAQLVHEGMPV